MNVIDLSFSKEKNPSEIWANQSSQHNRQRNRFIKQGKASRLPNFNGKYLKETFIKKNISYCNSIHPVGCDTKILTGRGWSCRANGNALAPIKLINWLIIYYVVHNKHGSRIGPIIEPKRFFQNRFLQHIMIFCRFSQHASELQRHRGQRGEISPLFWIIIFGLFMNAFKYGDIEYSCMLVEVSTAVNKLCVPRIYRYADNSVGIRWTHFNTFIQIVTG